MAQRAEVATGTQPARMLEAIGLNDIEERAYTLLIDHPGSTLAELATRLHSPRNRTRIIVESLARAGLVTRTPDKTPRYLPAPPDVAVEALIEQRQRELERVRKVASRLSRKATQSRHRAETKLAEIIVGGDSVNAHIDQLRQEAEQEIIAVVRPPLAPDAVIGDDDGLAALERGVRFRVVYDRAAFAELSDLEPLGRTIAAGGQARVFSPIPAPLVIVDGRAGLIPFDLDDPDAGWLLLRTSTALGVFVAYFDTLWERSAQLTITSHGKADINDTARADRDEDRPLIDLMAAGLRDDAIAAHLDVSQRTIDRRVRTLMEFLGARTRFQAGWLAAHQTLGRARPKRRRRTK